MLNIVKLPEGKYGELIHLLTVTNWDEPPSMDDMHELPKTVEMKKNTWFLCSNIPVVPHKAVAEVSE